VPGTCGGSLKQNVKQSGIESLFQIGNKLVGDAPSFIIAEIGINHNGDMDLDAA